MPVFAFAGWAIPLAVGAGLRLRHFDRVILGDDELHAVRTALQLPLVAILSTYHLADNCIPLTALYRVLLEAGVRLSEPVLRSPVAAASISLLLIAPWLVRRLLGAPTAAAFAWLAALSPVLVSYATMVRPYSIVATLSVFAAVAFFHWLEMRSAFTAFAYVALTAGAIHFHPLAAPFVLAPLGFGLAVALADSGAGRSKALAALARLGAAEALVLASLFVPARDSLLALVAAQREPRSIDLATLAGTGLLQAGTAHGGAASAFWIIALAGLLTLVRRRPRLGWYTLSLVVAQITGLVAVSPRLAHIPLVFDRYAIAVLPIVLLWVAAALAELGRVLPWPRVSFATATVAVLGALFLLGPLADPALRRSPFLHHNLLVDFTRVRPLSESLVPAFYRSSGGDERTIIEFPWDGTWRFALPFVEYQIAGGHQPLLASLDALFGDRRLALQTIVQPRLKTLLASPGTHLVIHRDLAGEQERLWAALDLGERYVRVTPETVRSRFREQARSLESRVRTEWGPPDTEDDAVLIWDLRRIRATACPARRARVPAAGDRRGN